MIQDTLQHTQKAFNNELFSEENYSMIMELCKILIWPLVTIIIVFILRKTIINLINRINKIGFGGIAAEASRQKEEIDRVLPEQGQKISGKNELVEKGLGIYSEYTLERASVVVDEESKVQTFDRSEDKINILYKYSQALYLLLNFERTYNTIFGSQLYLLERVNTHTESKESLKNFYDIAVKSYPEFYANYPYEQYLNFLINRDLIIFDENGNCSITWLGRDFLKFLVETGRTINKHH